MVGCSGVFRLCLMNAAELQSVADEELVRQLAMGLDEALASLQQRYGSLLASLASRRLDRPSAEEIVQDVFLTVWQHSPRFDPSRGSFRSWVFQIAHRRIMNELRRRRCRPQLEADPRGGLLDGLVDGAPGVAEQVAVDERRLAVPMRPAGSLPAAARSRCYGIPAAS